MRRRGSPERARALADAAAAAALAFGLFAFFRSGVPANDSWHTLLWGAELASGQLPDYQVLRAPTPHPLLILYAAALSPLGAAAEPALQLTGMVALGAIAVGVFRLGTRLYAWPVGLAAAVILLSRDRLLYLGARGSVDVMALALIVWAAVLEARQPRRGWPVLALLFLAGLLRPEAWLFAAAYWVWLVPARGWPARAGLGVLAAAAPLLWALSDYAVTGDPLWSLHGTQSLAGVLDRETGLSAFPGQAWSAFRSILKPPVFVLGVLGLIGGLVLRRRATLLPAAIVALALAAFVGLAAFSLPLNSRYLLPASFALTLFAAVASMGWTALSRGGALRALWGTAGVVTVAVAVVLQLPVVDSVRDKVVARQAIGSDLGALLETSSVQRAVARCGPLVAPSNFRRTQVAYATDRSEESVALPRNGLPTERGVYVRARTRSETTAPVKGYVPTSFGDFRRDTGPREARTPQGYSRLAASRFWIVYSRCGADQRRQAKTRRGWAPQR